MFALCGGCCCCNPQMCCCGSACIDFLVLLMGIVTSVTIVVVTIAEGMGFSETVTWHIIFMAIAVPFLLVAGRWAYNLDRRCLDCDGLHSIKGKGAEGMIGNGGGKGGKGDNEDNRWARRQIHLVIMSLATLTLFLGYVFIAIAHASDDKFFGYDFATDEWLSGVQVAHAWIGYLILLAVLFQVFFGLQKYWDLLDGIKSVRFHRPLGLTVIGVSAIQAILGMCAVGFSTTAIILLALLVLLMAYFGVVYPFPGCGGGMAPPPHSYGAAEFGGAGGPYGAYGASAAPPGPVPYAWPPPYHNGPRTPLPYAGAAPPYTQPPAYAQPPPPFARSPLPPPHAQVRPPPYTRPPPYARPAPPPPYSQRPIPPTW
eukprot:NODE_11555_length_1279_cov_1.884549.p1 GENE.NODE_11555_length_1279_cov_1.884549~~NODE_11555_length_1279_cov_1.884549.p1  ORF type:complete len:370 (-),score=109.69 NODE_11555_length_1279_cov_1.884549:19-1128(-)